MTFDDIKEMQIGSKKVKEAWLNGRQVYPSEKRIMDSLVCWYDPGKKQCTNESMAENPVLADLSGNGHDATCYNFAWSGMSGIGGYTTDFTNGYPLYVTVIERTYKLIHCTTTGTNCWLWHHEGDDFSVEPFSAKISGLKGQPLIYYYYDGTIRKQINITSDGVYDFPESILVLDNTNKIYLGFYIPANEQSLNVTIEQLPLYPNALVSDGVDDYARVMGLPLLTKERGYTVIAKRKNLYQLNEKGIVASKHSGNSYGAFQIEYNFNNVNATVWNFGASNTIQISSSEIIYQTSKSYNGETSLNIGTIDDTSILDLFKYINQYFGKVALYSFLLFNRDLTDAEIEWVKENMVEADGVMMYDWMDSFKLHNTDTTKRCDGTLTSYKITVTDVYTTGRFMESTLRAYEYYNSYKIKVTGLPIGVKLKYTADDTVIFEISSDGVYMLPAIGGTYNYVGFQFDNTFNGEDVTIQQLLTPLDQPLDSSLVDAWIFSGHTNDEAPSQIVGEKGIELQCSNFAWNEQGSGFKDGALYFDGVDDYCTAWNKLTCDRNVTVIGKRKLTTDEYNQLQNSLNIHIERNLPNILFLDYYEDKFESANGHKLKCVFGDYEYYYDNDTEPHSFWATKDAFNGQAYNNKVNDRENGLKYKYNIYLGRVWSGSVSACAWYYLAVYDKVMTEQEAQSEIEKLEKIWSNKLNNN